MSLLNSAGFFVLFFTTYNKKETENPNPNSVSTHFYLKVYRREDLREKCLPYSEL